MMNLNCGAPQSPSFAGKFLSAGVIDDAVKVSKKFYVKGCQANGKKIERETLDSFVSSGETYKKQLKEMAEALPDDVNLAFSKEKTLRGNKGLCLDFVHDKLGKVEVFGNPTNCRTANVRDNMSDSSSLGAVEHAINGLSKFTPEIMLKRFIAMNEGRITTDIQYNRASLKNTRKRIDTLAEFTDRNTTEGSRYLKGRLDYEYGKEAVKDQNKKDNRWFMLKNFFKL